MRISTRQIATLALLTAFSVILTHPSLRFPIFPMAPYLKYEFGDIPIFIATIMYGMPSGLLITFLASIIQGFTTSSSTGIWGIIMHILSTGVFVVVIAMFRRLGRKKYQIILGMVVAIIVSSLFMVLLNYLITPLYTNQSREDVAKLLLPIILPFNMIKYTGNSVVTMLLIFPLQKAIRFPMVDTKRKKQEHMRYPEISDEKTDV